MMVQSLEHVRADQRVRGRLQHAPEQCHLHALGRGDPCGDVDHVGGNGQGRSPLAPAHPRAAAWSSCRRGRRSSRPGTAAARPRRPPSLAARLELEPLRRRGGARSGRRARGHRAAMDATEQPGELAARGCPCRTVSCDTPKRSARSFDGDDLAPRDQGSGSAAGAPPRRSRPRPAAALCALPSRHALSLRANASLSGPKSRSSVCPGSTARRVRLP